MRKTTLVLIILAGIVLALLSMQEETVIIPKDAIRFRVIASSNKKNDQKIKKQVATKLKKEVFSYLKPEFTLEKSRETLQGNLPNFESVVSKTLEENHYPENFDIDYGQHYFPQKTYQGVVYEAGMYESLVVTLGNGDGENFWCVLFPPLCLLEAEPEKKVEYKSFVKEIIDKYFPQH